MNWENRKFQYSDGFFETIIVQNNEIRFWNEHSKRISYALGTLKFNYSPTLFDNIKNEILEKSVFDNSRVKIQFWRKGGGKYSPQINEIEYQIEAEDNKLDFNRTANKLGICETSEVISSKYSSFKCFLLPYITAAIEKEEKQVDDLIILNTKDEIAECISSNIFWMKDDVFYTPSLESGCLNGVMRSQVITKLKSQNIELKEGIFKIEHIKNADSIFCTNVTGITQFGSLDCKKLEIKNLDFNI